MKYIDIKWGKENLNNMRKRLRKLIRKDKIKLKENNEYDLHPFADNI